MIRRAAIEDAAPAPAGITNIIANLPLNVSIDPFNVATISIDPLRSSKVIFVDATFGNNATAIAYNFYYPYQTILAAKAVALAGDTIYIRKGTYTQTTISNSICDYYLEAGAIVQNTINNDVFAQSNGGTLNIYGYGILRSSVTNSAVIVAINNSTINIQCYKIIKNTNILGMALLCITGGKIYCDCYEIDCRFNAVQAAIILDANGFIQLTAQIVRFSFLAYQIGNSNNNTINMIINVAETIAYDMVLATGFNNNYCGFINNGSGIMVVNTRFSTAQTTNSTGSLSSIGLNWNNGGNICNLYINSPANNNVRTNNLFRTGNVNTNGKIIASGNFKNIQNTGVGVLNVGGTIDIKGKIEIDPTQTASPIEQQSGDLIINDLISIAPAAATYSINSPTAQNIKIYKHVTNKGYNPLITDLITGSLNIIDPDVN